MRWNSEGDADGSPNRPVGAARSSNVIEGGRDDCASDDAYDGGGGLRVVGAGGVGVPSGAFTFSDGRRLDGDEPSDEEADEPRDDWPREDGASDERPREDEPDAAVRRSTDAIEGVLPGTGVGAEMRPLNRSGVSGRGGGGADNLDALRGGRSDFLIWAVRDGGDDLRGGGDETGRNGVDRDELSGVDGRAFV